ncbi:MAG: phosphate ABC transporter permease PstA [Armatimonadota bacterium]
MTTLSGFERRRRIGSHIALGVCVIGAITVMTPVFLILGYLIYQGASSINLDLLTQLPKAPGELGGGIGQAVVGSFIMVVMALAIAAPIAIGAGIYLAEFGKGKWADTVRFSADVMNGVPSILLGVAVWSLIVVPMKGFSAFAGSVALAILMLPVITRTTEEAVRTVPRALREGSLGLGATTARTIWSVVIPAAKGGITTGLILAVSRAFGEAAPLLFTAAGSRFWNFYVDRPMASLPVQIFEYAKSPYADWHRQAWAAALVLIIIVLGLNIIARLATRQQQGGH